MTIESKTTLGRSAEQDSFSAEETLRQSVNDLLSIEESIVGARIRKEEHSSQKESYMGEKVANLFKKAIEGLESSFLLIGRSPEETYGLIYAHARMLTGNTYGDTPLYAAAKVAEERAEALLIGRRMAGWQYSRKGDFQ